MRVVDCVDPSETKYYHIFWSKLIDNRVGFQEPLKLSNCGVLLHGYELPHNPPSMPKRRDKLDDDDGDTC